MPSIQEILNTREKVKGSERNSILKEIYTIYENDNSLRIENWKRYCKWCREFRKKHDLKENHALFKKSKKYLKKLTPKQIAIKLSHIPTSDLYYIKSVCVDKANRKESIGAYLLGSVKVKK